MPRRRFVIYLILFVALLSIVGSVSAQDRDGDGVGDRVDRCPTVPGPASNNGCPDPNAPPVQDRDGDGVLDFVDRCPDQAGTGFTEGCPPNVTPGVTPGSPTAPVFPWNDRTRCLVGNPGPQNVNVRQYAADLVNIPLQPVIGMLPPGAQFEPLGTLIDFNNQVWYVGMGAALGLPDGVLGIVNGGVVINNGQCGSLPPFPGFPNEEPAPVGDACLATVIGDADVNVYAVPQADIAFLIGTLEPGFSFPPDFYAIDANGDTWYGSGGWVQGIDIELSGNCDNLPDFNLVYEFDTCMVMVKGAQDQNIYAEPLFSSEVIGTLPGGFMFVPETYVNAEENGEQWSWYGATGVALNLEDGVTGWIWVGELLDNMNCGSVPGESYVFPLEPGMDMCLFAASDNYIYTGADVHAEPSADSPNIGTLPPGQWFEPWFRDYDADGGLWLAGAIGPGGGEGWVSGNDVFDNGMCANLPQVVKFDAPPQLVGLPDLDWDGIPVMRPDGSTSIRDLFDSFGGIVVVDTSTPGIEPTATPAPTVEPSIPPKFFDLFDQDGSPIDLSGRPMIIFIADPPDPDSQACVPLGSGKCLDAVLLLPAFGDEPGQCPAETFVQRAAAADWGSSVGDLLDWNEDDGFTEGDLPLAGFEEVNLIGLLLPAVQKVREAAARGGVNVAVGDIDGDGSPQGAPQQGASFIPTDQVGDPCQIGLLLPAVQRMGDGSVNIAAEVYVIIIG
jgi:hypothetical protein